MKIQGVQHEKINAHNFHSHQYYYAPLLKKLLLWQDDMIGENERIRR